jgi:hypothetical protein
MKTLELTETELELVKQALESAAIPGQHARLMADLLDKIETE